MLFSSRPRRSTPRPLIAMVVVASVALPACPSTVVPLDAGGDSPAPRDAVDIVTRDAARTDVTDATDSAAPSCVSNADCHSDTVCEFELGCQATVGHCHSDGCQSLPVAPQYCSCDGVTIQQTSACLPDRPWGSMGACPPRDAGPVPPRRDAIMTWESPGGAAGWGPGLRAHGDGTIELWTMTGSVPLDTTVNPPDRTMTFAVDEMDRLFALWAALSLGSLPHAPTGFNECYPVVRTRLCAACGVTRISYSAPRDLLPEMNAVWDWFDARIAADSPRRYCGF
ncbi:MAG: hypothetical protein WCJ30_11910 [Deltaproteobacteria bacterium]